MAITKEMVVDMAWKTEGLVKVMQEKKDPQAKLLEIVQLDALMDLGIQENPDPQKLENTYKVMELFSQRYDNYDSGSRKYDII